jgi:tRNA nucleotidyltransferase (CCA-adding enzyme)
VLDAAAALTYRDAYEKRLILYAAICHDLGKVTTTRIIEGRLRSRGHEEAGVAPAKALLGRIAQNKDMMATVCKLVRSHMAPGQFVAQGAKAAAYKRLAVALAPHATIAQLALLAYADKRGRNPARSIPFPVTHAIPDVALFCERAAALGVLHGIEPSVLSGDDIASAIPAGPQRGAVLKKAYEIQIAEGVVDKEQLLKRVVKKQ